MTLLLLATLAAPPSGLQLGTIGDAEGCPMWQHLPASLSRVMPNLPVGKKRGTHDLWLTLVPTTHGARLTLKDRSRKAVLEREIPVQAGACRAAADSMALIIERYLHDIGWTPSSDGLPQYQPEPEPWRPVGLQIGLRGRAEAAWEPTRTRWGGELGGRLPLGMWEVVFLLGGTAPESQIIRRDDERRGRIWAGALDARAGGGACWRSNSRAVCGNLTIGIEMLHGSVSGAYLYQGTTTNVVQPLFSGEVRYEHAVGKSLHLSFGLGGAARPNEAGFAVEGATQTYRSPLWAASAQLGLWWTVL